MPPLPSRGDGSGPLAEVGAPPGSRWDEGLAMRAILGEFRSGNVLLDLIAERIRVAAGHLGLTRDDLDRIFCRHSVFEGETLSAAAGAHPGFLLVETHHLIQGRVGKGALKLVFPQDLLGKGDHFVEVAPGTVEVRPPPGTAGWPEAAAAEEPVRQAMREHMTGESLSMSLKSQATEAPFAGSEGLMLCAIREFDAATGRYRLKPALHGGEAPVAADKELIERMMNEAGAMLTRVGRIAFDRIVHAAETNSTLTARLGLQLATNVVEGHLRTLLDDDPGIIIGDEDMTSRLRELRGRAGYAPTACALAVAAARMQREHEILLPASRERLRGLLDALPAEGSPSPTLYREILDLFFGSGPVQRSEDELYHHREPILRSLSVALSTRCLDEAGEAHVLALFLRTLLDNQWIMLERALARLLPSGQALPVGWFHDNLLLLPEERRALAALGADPALSREAVKEAFWGVTSLLCDARDRAVDLAEPYRQARADVLERAIRAVTATGDVVPTVDRIVFFTLPLAYECATPKLGVVTRKPVELCGSALRPEAMAEGARMAIEILLKRVHGRARPFEGLTVAIEGLGNAGKNVAQLMAAQGATVVAVSDSRGALVCPGGFPRQTLAAAIAHKNAGRRFDTFMASPVARRLPPATLEALTYHPDPETLKAIAADILVLTAIPASVRADHASRLRVKVVCELTGAAVTGEAKRILKSRGIEVIPDNLASSGGLLVSLSEMLQNSTGQCWARALEERNLYAQLARSFDAVWTVADRYQTDLATASDILALRRMHELAIYREHLERLAAALAARIGAIPATDRVLVLSDNDEDGVASAAILQALVAHLNPAAEACLVHLNESFRAEAVPALVRQAEAEARPIRHVFALDRAVPVAGPGRRHLLEIAARCQVTFVNNHDLPPDALGGTPGADPGAAGDVPTLASLGVLVVSPQTLRSTLPAAELPTAMILYEVASAIVRDERVLDRIAWKAAVGCCLDVAGEGRSDWLLFSSRFNPDRTIEAARAVRLVTRANGYLSAIRMLASVERPDQLETHAAWGRFLAEYRTLNERVQVLVERIVLENRGRSYVTHFFTHDEVASPTPVAGNDLNELDFYHWFSERLIERGDLAGKPILVGQVVSERGPRRWLGVRLRSPRGVDLMQAGLPAGFKSAGLPHTAIARLPLEHEADGASAFQQLVEVLFKDRRRSPVIGAEPRLDSGRVGRRAGVEDDGPEVSLSKGEAAD